MTQALYSLRDIFMAVLSSYKYISVVIPTYNRENLLRYTLESLRKKFTNKIL
ncbi:glycosyltransferase [Aeromonas sp. HMWF016]|uniref:glycosyltransferase n=1 Tax=Aeromonas sp. HMWF016 TaxID=2056852 RepID=UPI0035BF9D2F